ncbi:Hypothetical protein RADP37_03515 [Roseomonas mucosa]|uniref:Uncharacterized protein n=1 Tax=Roseomonas mucosa TaxID=207340 RepID=A0A4Y1N1P4_9PROT|nr:Hypothetical protein RADP37_03515 [Roseomonas mucosa]
MSDLTNYARDMLARTLCGRAPTPPGAVYAALGSAGSATGGVTGEPAGTGYARQRVTFNGTGSQSNAEVLRFTFTAAAGTLGYLGLFDAASGGNPLTFMALSQPVVMSGPGTVTVAASRLVVAPD